jgi:hypothetical protein
VAPAEGQSTARPPEHGKSAAGRTRVRRVCKEGGELGKASHV